MHKFKFLALFILFFYSTLAKAHNEKIGHIAVLTGKEFLIVQTANAELAKRNLDLTAYRITLIKEPNQYDVLYEDKTYKAPKDAIVLSSPRKPFKPSFSVELSLDGKVIRAYFER